MQRSDTIRGSVHSFLRIPGISDEGTHTTLALDGNAITLAQCIDLLSSAQQITRHRAIRILEEVSSPSRTETHLICSALIGFIERHNQDSPLAESALIHFLGSQRKSLEALNIGSQLLQRWGQNASDTTPRQALVQLLGEEICQLRFTYGYIDRPDIVAKRYVLFRAFEVSALRASAACAIEAILEDNSPALLVARRSFAGQFLAFLRSLPNCEPDYDPLRRLATSVFATGFPTRTPLVSNQTTSLRSSTPILAYRESTHAISATNAPEARALMSRLLTETTGLALARLGPQDYEVLRKIKGLSLDEFRGITGTIRLKAASDPWARAAILDLVRAPHDSAVSHSVRTAVLGALVNDARKIGTLSSQVEREVYAISAEIPALPLSIEQPDASSISTENLEECDIDTCA